MRKIVTGAVIVAALVVGVWAGALANPDSRGCVDPNPLRVFPVTADISCVPLQPTAEPVRLR